MMRIVKFILLFIPLYWYLLLWDSLVFHIDIPRLSIGDDYPAWVEDIIGPIFLFLGLPLSLLIGSVYTFLKKYWRWFTCYMLLGGVPIIIFLFGVIID